MITPTARRERVLLEEKLRNSFVVAFMAPSMSQRAAGQAVVVKGGPAMLSPGRMDRPQISVVIPLFNEEENVRLLLDELVGELEKLGRTYEVICVDDGSRDRTFAELARAAAERRSCA